MTSTLPCVASIVGARPNFVKIAPIAAEFAAKGAVRHVLIHTGQHFEPEMSEAFLQELGLGEPDIRLGVRGNTPTRFTAMLMNKLEPVLGELAPELVIVPGDVNSSLAGALVAVKLGIPVAHVEAGLRSFDRTMPEEINRVLVDAVSDLLFIHSPEAEEHLLAEGRPASAIYSVGNTMIDTLVRLEPAFASRSAASAFHLRPGSYLLVTLHRPALVDGPLLKETIAALRALSEMMPVVFPVHPRTREQLAAACLDLGNIRVLQPLGYLDFMSLMSTARGVVTDSGGVQEETTFLGVPCMTLRANTERPVTVDVGTNVLLGLSPAALLRVPQILARHDASDCRVPELWDGHAADRVARVIEQWLRPSP